MAEEVSSNPTDSEQQPPAGGNTAPEQAVGTGEPKVVEAPRTEAPAQEDAFFDAKNLSPDLAEVYKNMQAAYTRKTQEIAAVRDKAKTFDQLVSYQPFVDWYNNQRNGNKKPEVAAPENAPEVISDEEFSSLFNDKNKFSEHLKKAIREYAEKTVLPVTEAVQRETRLIKREAEINAFAQDHADFWDLDAKNLIEPLIIKYPSMELDDIYKLAKFPFLQEEAINKAHNAVQQKKQAVVEKPNTGVASSSLVKVKNRREAMELAYDYASQGKPLPEFIYEK